MTIRENKATQCSFQRVFGIAEVKKGGDFLRRGCWYRSQYLVMI